MEKIIVASADGHAAMPGKLWPEYLEKKYHRYLDRLRVDQEVFGGSMQMLNDLMLSPEAIAIFDTENAYRAGQWQGLWDKDIRLQEMDREGVAAELVFVGDARSIDLFFNTSNASYALPAMDSGARAFNRWAYDAFGSARDRLLLIGAPMTGLDMDGMIAEAHWMADRGFAGVFTPNYCAVPGQISIYDSYWDPLWRVYAERNLVLITHAGWGLDQGLMHGEVEAAIAEVKAHSGDRMELASKLIGGIFNAKGVFSDLRSRKVVWQLMLAGVFDRHPGLKMMETEVRGDWIPAALAMLDQAWEQHRSSLAAKRRPSEYWQSNCMAGLSFMNKAEVNMRREIGVDTLAFGRDYPHTESTWPNTLTYFSDLFRSVPENEVRAVLGGNLVRFFGLDRAKLAKLADRIGPTFKQIAEGAGLSPELLAHLNMRCGYSNPPEGGERIPEMEALLKADLPRIAAASLVFR